MHSVEFLKDGRVVDVYLHADLLGSGYLYIQIHFMKKQILVSDDHTIVRKGVVNLIHEHFPFVETGEAENGSVTISQIRSKRYDLLILDLNLPDANADKIMHLMRAEGIDIPVIVFSMYPVQVMEKSMLKLGATRYVSKGDDLKYLKWAIEEVLMGKKTGQLGAEMPESVSNPFASLTPKELTVMIALFDGKSNKEIAEEYALSPSTVATYKQRMLEKTGSRSVTEMLKVAMQFHLYGFPGAQG